MSPDEVLPALIPALGKNAEHRRWRCNVSELGYRPHNRAVLLYSVRGTNLGEHHEFIGKIHRKTSRAAKMFANHSQIHRLTADSKLIVPKPILFAEHLNLMVMERVEGTVLHDMLLKPTEAYPLSATLRLAAQALARYRNR